MLLALVALASIQQATPGTGPTPYWLDIAREYTERWVHHAQIRLAVGATPLLARHWLHPVLDAFMRCLPRAYDGVEAHMGSVVRIEVVGDSGGGWFVRRCPDRWRLATDADGPPTALVRMDADTAWRLLSRTMTIDSALPAIAIEGDETLARVATKAAAIMTTQL